MQEKIKINLEFDSLLAMRTKLIDVVTLIDRADLEMQEYIERNKITTVCKVYGGNIVWSSTAYIDESVIDGLFIIRNKHLIKIKTLLQS